MFSGLCGRRGDSSWFAVLYALLEQIVWLLVWSGRECEWLSVMISHLIWPLHPHERWTEKILAFPKNMLIQSCTHAKLTNFLILLNHVCMGHDNCLYGIWEWDDGNVIKGMILHVAEVCIRDKKWIKLTRKSQCSWTPTYFVLEGLEISWFC